MTTPNTIIADLLADNELLKKQLDEATTKIDQLEWENKGVAEWRSEALRFHESDLKCRVALQAVYDQCIKDHAFTQQVQPPTWWVHMVMDSIKR